MKKKIIIANWKMNLLPGQVEKLTEEILTGLKKSSKDLAKIDIVLAPSFVGFLGVAKKLWPKSFLKSRLKFPIYLGAQDLFWETKGAFTGEVSPEELKEFGVSHVIIGHSERREIFGETDEMVHKKVKAALEAGIIPIICVGETFEERREGQKDYVIIRQLSKALEGINLKASQKIIIAYEPIWVIGSGQAVAPEEAEYVNRVIYQRMVDLYPWPIVRNNIRIIYGGSVDRENVKDFVSQETIDGVLVGGASLKADEFVKIAEIIASSS